MFPAFWFSSLGVASPVVQLSTRSAATGTDGDLVQRAAVGDRLAQHALYERHAQRVLLRVTRLLGRVAEAEDVVQDAFVQALRDIAQLREPEHFGHWVNKIAVHQVHRRFRRRRLRRALGLERGQDDAALGRIADPHADPATHLRLSQLDGVLAKLPARWRLAWMLRHVEGCALLEVAEQCECSLASVKRYISHAEEQIKEELNWEWGGPAEATERRVLDAG